MTLSVLDNEGSLQFQYRSIEVDKYTRNSQLLQGNEGQLPASLSSLK